MFLPRNQIKITLAQPKMEEKLKKRENTGLALGRTPPANSEASLY